MANREVDEAIRKLVLGYSFCVNTSLLVAFTLFLLGMVRIAPLVFMILLAISVVLLVMKYGLSVLIKRGESLFVYYLPAEATLRRFEIEDTESAVLAVISVIFAVIGITVVVLELLGL